MRTIISLFCLIALNSFGANHYINAGATGANNGTSWTDAWTALPAPTAWIRGDTYYIGTGTWATPTNSTAASGTNTITIKKAWAADHGTDTGWSSSYANPAYFSGSWCFRSPYWTVDGSYRTTWTNGYGFVMTGKTPKGPGFYLTTEPENSYNYYGAGVSNITIRYVSYTGHASTADSIDNGSKRSGDNAIWIDGPNYNTLVEYCHFFAWRCCHVKGGYAQAGPNYTGGHTVRNMIFRCNWCEYNVSEDASHSEGVFITRQEHNTWQNNVWVDIEGTGVIMYGMGSNNVAYGNVVYWTPLYPRAQQTGYKVTNCTFGQWNTYCNYNNFFYQNTIVVATNTPGNGGYQYGFTAPANGVITGVARNNLWVKTSGTAHDLAFAGVNSDYNAYYNCNHASQSHAQALTSIPFVNYSAFDFHLSSNTVSGVDLGSPYDVDFDGNLRTTWTRGAYEFNGEPPEPTPAYISTQPQNTSGYVGQSATFTVVAGGSTPISYQWKVSGTNVSATTSAFTISGITMSMDGLQVSVGVTNEYGGSISDAAYLSVTEAPATLSLSVVSLNFGVHATNTITDLTIGVTNSGSGTLAGTASVSVPWSIVSGGSYFLGSGQGQITTVRYSPTTAEISEGSIAFTGGGGGAVSLNGSSYVVQPLNNIQMSLATISTPFQLSSGSLYQSITTSTDPTAGGFAYAGFNLPSESQITIGGNVIASNLTQNSFFIEIDSRPAGSSQAWDILPVTGSSVTWMPVGRRGTGTADSPQYPVYSWTLSGGNHYVSIHGREEYTFLQALYVTNSPAPVILIQPESTSKAVGQNAVFTITADGEAPLSYAWTFNGSPVGTDSSSYTRSNVQVADNGGAVVCTVSNDYGFDVSSTATLTVSDGSIGPVRINNMRVESLRVR